METTNKLGIILTLFIGVIVCLAMIPDIASNIQDMTVKRNVAGESHSLDIAAAWNVSLDAAKTINESYIYTVTNAPDDWKINKCPLEGFTIGNSTENYTVTTDYVLTASAGTYYLMNTSTTIYGGNDTLVGYDYCDDGYITNSGGRGIAKMILIFAAFGLLGYAVYLGAKDFL